MKTKRHDKFCQQPGVTNNSRIVFNLEIKYIRLATTLACCCWGDFFVEIKELISSRSSNTDKRVRDKVRQQQMISSRCKQWPSCVSCYYNARSSSDTCMYHPVWEAGSTRSFFFLLLAVEAIDRLDSTCLRTDGTRREAAADRQRDTPPLQCG